MVLLYIKLGQAYDGFKKKSSSKRQEPETATPNGKATRQEGNGKLPVVET